MNQTIDIESMLENADYADALAETFRLDYEESFYDFFAAGWKYIDPSPFTYGPPLEAVAEHLEAVAYGDIKRLIINIPPRMSKSSLTSVSFPAWVWAQRFRSPTSGAGVQFLHASYSQQLSLRDSVKCRRLIESPWYQSLWGSRFKLTSDQNTKTRFDNSLSGSRLCTSVGSTLTGEGGNIIVVDDPNAAQEAFSEASIESTIDWWDTALSTRLNDAKTGAFIIIQQRLAENDLTGHILEKDIGDWTHLMLPMRYEPARASIIYPTKIGWSDWRQEEGELLWPDRFGEDEVRSLERTLGPFGAAGQLQQRPEIKGGGIIHRDWWQLWEEPTHYPRLDYIVASLDTAYTNKQENDPSAMTVWGVFSDDAIAVNSKQMSPDGKLYRIERTYKQPHPKVILLHAWEEWLEFPDLTKKVLESCRRWKIDTLLVEDKAAGHSIAQELRRVVSGAEFGIILENPKSQDKVSRLYSIQNVFSEGMIYAPEMAWADKVITQCSTVPKAKHDDLADTVSQAIGYLRRTGSLRLPDEILQDDQAEMRHAGKPPAPLYAV